MKRLALFLITPLLLSGCISVQSEPVVDGGFYRSIDNAQTFERLSSIATVGEQSSSFAGQNVEFMTFDPSDTKTIYFTTRESRIYVTQDAGQSWRELLKNKGIVNKVLINPDEPCHLHAQTRQNIFYSNDCGRSWSNIYLEKVRNRTIRDLVFDPGQTNRLFMTLSDKSIQVSDDSGVTWRVWGNRDDQGLEYPIQQLHINPQNNQIAYAVTEETLYRSSNQGLTWEDLGPIIVKDFEFKNGKQVTQLVFIPEVSDGFYTVSKYGILKTLDGGVSWEGLTLLPKPKKETILSLAVNPATMDELYYGTAKAIYYTKDGGVNWQTLKSPSSRRNTEMLIHPQNSSVLYVGVYSPPE